MRDKYSTDDSNMPRIVRTDAGTLQVSGYGTLKNFADDSKARDEYGFRSTAWELGLTPSDNPDEWRELRNLYR